MPKCAFKYCTNSSKYIKQNGVSYFSFPQDPFLCAEWISVVAQQRCRELYTPNILSVVCSEHFNESDMYDTDEGLQLNDTAVPCIDLPDDVTIVEISSTPNSKKQPKNAIATDSSSTSQNSGLINARAISSTSNVAKSMDVVNTTEVVNEKKAINTETANTMEVVDATVDAGDVVKTSEVNTEMLDAIEPVSNMELVNTPEVSNTSKLDSTSCDTENASEVDMMDVINIDETASTIIDPVSNTNALNARDVAIIEEFKANKIFDSANHQIADSKTVNNEELQETVNNYRKKLNEKNEIINMLHKRNDRLNRRIDSLKKQLRAAHKKIGRDRVVGETLCKTLFFRYVRNYEHLYRNQPQDQDDEDEEIEP